MNIRLSTGVVRNKYFVITYLQNYDLAKTKERFAQGTPRNNDVIHQEQKVRPQDPEEIMKILPEDGSDFRANLWQHVNGDNSWLLKPGGNSVHADGCG